MSSSWSASINIDHLLNRIKIPFHYLKKFFSVLSIHLSFIFFKTGSIACEGLLSKQCSNIENLAKQLRWQKWCCTNSCILWLFLLLLWLYSSFLSCCDDLFFFLCITGFLWQFNLGIRSFNDFFLIVNKTGWHFNLFFLLFVFNDLFLFTFNDFFLFIFNDFFLFVILIDLILHLFILITFLFWSNINLVNLLNILNFIWRFILILNCLFLLFFNFLFNGVLL